MYVDTYTSTILSKENWKSLITTNNKENAVNYIVHFVNTRVKKCHRKPIEGNKSTSHKNKKK